MPTKKTKTGLMNTASEETMMELASDFPEEPSYERTVLPRLGMVSQDKMEKDGKNVRLVASAGTFFVERQTDETDENGKKVYEKTEVGETVSILIAYARKQLSYYDEDEQIYVSTPVYDDASDIIPLFREKKEIARGTEAELKAMFPAVTKTGRPSSKLRDEKVLYVLLDGEPFQMSLRGSNLWAFRSYARKVAVPTVLTTITSEPQENGSIQWNQMVFTASRKVTQEEATQVLELRNNIKQSVEAEKVFFGKSSAPTVAQAQVVSSASQTFENF